MTKNKPNTKKPANTQCIGDNADLCATAELIRNGGPIDWRYWSARREITPQEAAKLAHCIDPIQWPYDQHAQGPILNDLHIKIQRLAALLAERNQKWTLVDLAAMLGNNSPLFMREIANLAQQSGAPTAGKVGTNRKTWDDAKLRALWDESIMPGVTKKSLAEKNGVSRQRIGVLLANAQEKFKVRNSWTDGMPAVKPKFVKGKY